MAELKMGDGFWHGPGPEIPSLEGNIQYGDSDNLLLGDRSGGDVSFGWDGTNLVLKPGVDDTGAFHIGDGTTDFDVKWFGGTTAKYVLFDMGNVLLTLEDVDLHLGDNDQAQFGDATGGDVTMVWDGTNMLIRPIADGTGILYLGDDTLAFSQVKIGTQANTAGSGPAMSASVTSVFRVYGDDGGASIGSGTFARVGVFRHLLTYTGGNREQEAGGVVGQLVSVAGTNRHNMAGVWGSYEVQTSLTVDGQAAATDTWAQAAVLGRVGAGSAITTINANGVLAGFAAMSNTASFAANNGVFAGFYAGAWSGGVDWGYGLYVETGKTAIGIYVGDTSSHGIQVVNSALTVGDSYSGVRVAVTAAAANNAYGVAAYFDSTLTGTQAGGVYNTGSWINLAASYVGAASYLVVPFEGGVYDAGGTLTSSRIIFGGQHQAILSSAPGKLHAWRLNTTQTITSLIAAANSGSVGYTAGAGVSGTQLGYIPFIEIVGVNSGNPVYLRVYDSAT